MKRWFAAALVVMAAGFALPAPASAQQAQATAQDAHPAWLVGDWSVDGCANLFGLRADGKVDTSDGGATWRYAGDSLIFTIDGKEMARQIVKVSDDSFRLVNGPTFTRCNNAPPAKP